MKKGILWLLVVCTLSFAGCKVGKSEALNVYTCPKDNMFGLEKVEVNENNIVVTFDRKINDESLYGECKRGVNSKENFVSLADLSNLGSYRSYDTSIVVKGGKYISTTYFEYDEAKKFDPALEVEVVGVKVLDQVITFSGGDLELMYTMQGGECFDDFYQTYHQADKTWGEIEHEFTAWPLIQE